LNTTSKNANGYSLLQLANLGKLLLIVEKDLTDVDRNIEIKCSEMILLTPSTDEHIPLGSKDDSRSGCIKTSVTRPITLYELLILLGSNY